jgi:hypothetical protein
MKSRIGSKGFRLAIAVLVLLALVVGGTFALEFKQSHDKAAVREYVTRVRPKIAADPRFQDIRLMGYSCDNVLYPYMPIFGTVSSQENRDALNNLIQTSKPPVTISVRHVRVSQDNWAPKGP